MWAPFFYFKDGSKLILNFYEFPVAQRAALFMRSLHHEILFYKGNEMGQAVNNAMSQYGL